MDGLADTLRQQQDLSDDAFRDLQDGQGEGPPDALAQRQQQLRQQLEGQRRALPGAETEEGQAARRALEDAGEAMDRAEDDLRGGDLPGGDRQSVWGLGCFARRNAKSG